jgi:DMSO/TMAO reductase YedYZ molybdopterin-dependent catalytic subunit
MKKFGAIVALTILLLVSLTRPTAAQTATATLKVTGDVTTPLSLTPADVKGLPRTKVEAKSGERVVVYEGVRISEILKKAGVPLGGDHGKSLTMYVLATASDGYQAVFSIGELDPELTNNDIIVADTVDGKPLSAEQGQFRIVAPRDVKGARSMRMLERLEVVRIKKQIMQ